MRPPPPFSQVPRFPIVAGLAALAVGVTVAPKFNVDVSALYDSPAIGRGEVWRLLTSILPHGGPFHLIFNVYWLWVFGSLVEESFGQWKTFALIVLLALGSGAAEYAFLDGGIGLSGVVYGLFGMVWVLSRYSPRFTDAVDVNTAVMFVAWFFLCIVTTATGFFPVANLAHGVGAVLGALVGLAVAGPRPGRVAAGAGAVLLTAAFTAGAVFARPYINFASDRGMAEARSGYDALKADRYEVALRWYLDSVRMRPQEAGSWLNLGIIYDHLSEHGKADAAFEKAWQLQPANEEFKKAYESRRNNPTTRGA